MHSITSPMDIYPFSANDISVIDNGVVRKFRFEDWDADKHKLLVLLPTGDRIVCATELGAMKDWYNKFLELNCELILLGTDPARALLDWIDSEELLRNPPFKVFSSYLLPARLNLVENGRAKRASIFVSESGEVVRQEYPEKVGRSFSELNRMVFAYNQDSFCGSGWKDPSDNLK